MTLTELGKEYKRQAEVLEAKINGLIPLLHIYTGEDLLILRKRIKIYSDMKFQCLETASVLNNYYCDVK